MIQGARHWGERLCYHAQNNNPTEQYLKKLGVAAWLQTCGPTAAVNCLDALGYKLAIQCPGLYKPQPEEVLSDYFNDPANEDKFVKFRPDIAKTPGNYWPTLYPLAVREVFEARATFLVNIHNWAEVCGMLWHGAALQLHLVKPAHYIAAVAYDEAAQEIIFHDSWPREANKYDGFANRMTRKEYEGNVRDFLVRYNPPPGVM